jgi:hypothetical protein
MRRAFSIAAVTGLILWITLASSKTPGDLDAIKGEFHNQLLIEGLHVALPDRRGRGRSHMRTCLRSQIPC